MNALVSVVVILIVIAVFFWIASVRIIKRYVDGVLLRLGKVIGDRKPGFRMIIPLVDVLHRVSLRVVTMPIRPRASSPATTSASMSPASPTSRWSTP